MSNAARVLAAQKARGFQNFQRKIGRHQEAVMPSSMTIDASYDLATAPASIATFNIWFTFDKRGREYRDRLGWQVGMTPWQFIGTMDISGPSLA